MASSPVARTALPRELFVVHHQSGDLAHPDRETLLVGLHSCGTAPDSHRTSLYQRYGARS